MRKYIYLISIIVLIVLSACTNTGSQSLTAEDIVAQSVTRMRSMAGYSFLIARSGEYAYLDSANSIAFSRAEGSFNSPDQVSAKVKAVVVSLGILAEVETISLGDDQWQTNMLTGLWEQVESGSGFNPSVLLHPDTGILSLLTNDLTNLVLNELTELEEVPGKQLHLISATLDGEKAYDLSFGLMGPQAQEVRIWISPDTFELYRLEVVEQGDEGGEGTTWILDFWDFDAVVEIISPQP